MFAIDDPTAVAVLPTPEAAGTPGFFTEGNPALGQAATYVRASWLNALQQELLNVLAGAGISPSKTAYDQLLTGLRSNALITGNATGAANTYAVVYTPAITALVDGMVIWFKASAANTGASTLAINGIAAKAIVGGAHAALQGGEIIANGKCMVVWNATLNSFVLIECTGAALQVAPATQTQHAPQMSQVAGVVGTVRNLAMTVNTASASGTMTADEIIVETALGGVRYCLPSFNKTINLATTGAGGMDTGTAPVSGYVALYAIYNPTTGASALLAVNATAASAPSIYGGANMPAGYTASGLVSVWPTNGSGQFINAVQQDRKILFPRVQVLNTTTVVTQTTLSIASAVPANAKVCSGYIVMLSNTASNMALNLWPYIGASFITHPFNFTVTANVSLSVPFENAHVAGQNIVYSNTSSAGAITMNIMISGYTI